MFDKIQIVAIGFDKRVNEKNIEDVRKAIKEHYTPKKVEELNKKIKG